MNQQQVNVDSLINDLANGILQFGSMVKEDKAKTNERIKQLQEEIETLKKDAAK